MKRTMKSFTVLALALIISLPALAQPRNGDRGRNADREMFRDLPPEVRAEAHLAVFDQYLDLSDTQEEQIKEIDEEFALKGKELREEKVNRMKKMTMSKELRDEHQKAIHGVLTKEQYAIYLDKKEAIEYDIRQRLKDHPKGDN